MERMRLGRRGFMAALGFGAAAAPIAGQQLATTRGVSALGGLAYGMGGDAPQPASVGYGGPWDRSGITKLIWKSLQKERQEKARQFERSLAYRYGALEPGIAAMRSWSPSFANTLQRHRDEAHMEWLREQDNKLWPDSDD